ncbi:hypothetical protein G4B88_025927 [Cannabis sativa]|uniref:Non-specific lipid-transfer protein n=1 Tax=Cannabis sativa TaxID=3483 RepID=A0A7J6HH17_CANSA|nr:hypothetical protein G4B88_025927 [Cannabis sativa]
MVIASPVMTHAITCSQVDSNFDPCLNYLTFGGSGTVPAKCCNGLKSLSNAARTPANRQATCNCLKETAGRIKGFDYNLAAGLPGKCGVSIPCKITPFTN